MYNRGYSRTASYSGYKPARTYGTFWQDERGDTIYQVVVEGKTEPAMGVASRPIVTKARCLGSPDEVKGSEIYSEFESDEAMVSYLNWTVTNFYGWEKRSYDDD